MAGGGRWLRHSTFIRDHLTREDFPREAKRSLLADALDDFRRTRQENACALQTEQQKLKQGRVAEIAKKLREEVRQG